jgi:hypothetical protein
MERAIENPIVRTELFYPGGDIMDSLPCTTLDSVVKRLKESDLVVLKSDLVVTRSGNLFGDNFFSFQKVLFKFQNFWLHELTHAT